MALELSTASVLFHQDFVDPLKRHEKTTTIREWDTKEFESLKRDVENRKVVRAKTNYAHESTFGYLAIYDMKTIIPNDLKDSDLRREGFKPPKIPSIAEFNAEYFNDVELDKETTNNGQKWTEFYPYDDAAS